MAYRFNGTSDWVKFAIAPLNGYVVGPITMALLCRRNTISTFDVGINVINSGFTSHRALVWFTSSNFARFSAAGLNDSTSTLLSDSASAWYLLAATWAGTGTKARLHVHDGASWSHGDGALAITGSGTIGGTDVLSVSSPYGADWFAGDIACAGIKKATSTDGEIETLTRTAFSTWQGFGFDWLVGFDASLESGGVLQDQGAAGTGDEISRSGTTRTPTGDPMFGAIPLGVQTTKYETGGPLARTPNTPALITRPVQGGIRVYTKAA